ncbi:MAG: hypothetical protein GW778_08460 [Alphaproteobacteria bacterium]|nr:hypothetical protein [Alphaproteobacteria bacterium]
MSWSNVPGLRTEFPRKAAGETGGGYPQQQQQQQYGWMSQAQIQHGGQNGVATLTPAPDYDEMQKQRELQQMLMTSDL